MTTQDHDALATAALRMIGPDPANWVPNRPGIDHNVAILGGGQSGIALSFALRRAGIGKVTAFDAAPDERHAGIWLTAARMNMLRTPKGLPGPEYGIPALGFQAWYESRHGQAAYDAIERIARTSTTPAPPATKPPARSSSPPAFAAPGINSPPTY